METVERVRQEIGGDRLVDEVSRDLVEAVSKVMQLLGVMAVVIQHVLQKSKGFFW